MKERGRTGDSEALGKKERLLPSGSPKRVGQEPREGRISSPREPNRWQNQGSQQQKTDETE